jgi:hypothetical protein
MLRLLKLLAVDGHSLELTPALVHPNTVKRLKMLSQSGIALVCYTFAIFYVRKEFVGYGTEKIQTGILNIRKKFATHRLKITEQLETILQELDEKGQTIAHHFAMPVIDEDGPATLPVELASPLTPNVAASASAVTPLAASAVRRTPPPPEGLLTPLVKKVRLADRLRQRTPDS